jgi:hypothetical protein
MFAVFRRTDAVHAFAEGVRPEDLVHAIRTVTGQAPESVA